MDIYLVGGAVRDALLGRSSGDRDHVVVGATQQQLLDLGYKAVGRDFPVFLHPHTREEHALARTERKSARGYRGFVVDADSSVTLEQDLSRRDFTINAIAQATDGTLIDPYGGARDLEARVLRHVSDAFVEDPVRILRAARFMARFASLGFSIAAETMALMQQMVIDGEVDALVPERVWQETARALAEPTPSAFLATLRACGALARVMPEVDALYGVPQRKEFHPEVDTGVHVEMVCDMAARLAPGDVAIGFAALTHDLGKALTPAEVLPKHIGHEHSGKQPLAALCKRLKPPQEMCELAFICCREHLNVHRLDELRDETVVELIARCDGWRKPLRIEQLATVCEADKRGRLGMQDSAYPQAATLRALFAAALAVKASDVISHDQAAHDAASSNESSEPLKPIAGKDIGERIRRARISAVHCERQRLREG
ncbi:MAG: multifunctional CCA addition/repair protein [Lysobacteraceae bacterium]